MEKHFVTFYSPGTFLAETTILPIESWDVDEAVRLSRTISERHNALPYGFRFSTRSRGENDLDSAVVKRSATYFLGGEVLTLAELEATNDPKDAILIANMRSNGFAKVVRNNNSWQWTQPLEEGDIVLDAPRLFDALDILPRTSNGGSE